MIKLPFSDRINFLIGHVIFTFGVIVIVNWISTNFANSKFFSSYSLILGIISLYIGSAIVRR